MYHCSQSGNFVLIALLSLESIWGWQSDKHGEEESLVGVITGELEHVGGALIEIAVSLHSSSSLSSSKEIIRVCTFFFRFSSSVGRDSI